MEIRLAKEAELPKLMRIFDIARNYQKSHGNPTQWPDDYPDSEIVLRDIQRDHCYVVTENSSIAGTFTLIPGDDPTYHVIENGSWLDDSPYSTIHRLAGNGTIHGIGYKVISFCRERSPHLRADTHRDNLIMRHIIEKSGFRYCGIIHVDDGTPRLAYELI